MSEENKFLKVPIWYWDGLQGFIALIGFILATAGILWGIYEYRSQSEANRAQATLDLLDVWEERGYLDQYKTLRSKVQKTLATVPENEIKTAEKNPSIEAALYEKVSARVLSDPSSREAFENLIYFFQRQHLCIEAGLCSEKATEVFFEDTVSSFVKIFLHALSERPSGLPDFATPDE